MVEYKELFFCEEKNVGRKEKHINSLRMLGWEWSNKLNQYERALNAFWIHDCKVGIY